MELIFHKRLPLIARTPDSFNFRFLLLDIWWIVETEKKHYDSSVKNKEESNMYYSGFIQ